MGVIQGSVIYRSPWVRPARLLLRMKLLQVGTMVAGAGAPALLAVRGADLALSEVGIIASTFAGSLVLAGSLAYITERFVGEMRLRKEARSVVVSTLSLWGNRVDRVYPIASVVPLAPRSVQQRKAVPLAFRADAKARQHIIILRDDHAVDKPRLERLLTGANCID